jgi:tRNA pseudouridine synthase 10
LETVLNQVLRLIQANPLCDYCLGRQFARLGFGLSNRERGRALKLSTYMDAAYRGDMETLKHLAINGMLPEAASHFSEAVVVERRPCYICNGALSEENFKMLADRIVRDLQGYEFSTFLVGASVPADVREKEDGLRSAYSITHGEDLKNDVTRELGLLLTDMTGRKADHKSPDILVVADIFNMGYRIQPTPVFLKGRYRKHSRELPQSPWHCRKCWGRGCVACGFTGREYPTSVAELIGEPVKRLFEAEGFKFHAAGREDVDALVGGTGRPFVLELKRPRKRFVPLDMVERAVNESAGGLVEAVFEGFAGRKDVRELKLTSPYVSKTYQLHVFYEEELDPDRLGKVVETFRDLEVEQRTPTRVLRRRGERVRRKKVYEVAAELIGGREVVFKVRCQGGLYVKELVTGDNGRTKPSFADILGQVPSRIELTVLSVHI